MTNRITPGKESRQGNAGTLAPAKAQYLDIKSFLEARTHMLAKVASGYVTPDRLLAVALGAIGRTPALRECTPESLFNCCYLAASIGLEVGSPLGHAYMVPYRNKFNQNKREATFIPGWRGLAFKAMECGAAKAINAAVWYEGDEMTITQGTTQELVHVPTLDASKRGEPVGAYSIITLPDGTVTFQIMLRPDIEKRRRQSKARDSMMWTDFWEEGACKTVLRHHFKYLPLTTAKAVETMSNLETVDQETVKDVAVTVTTSAGKDTDAGEAPTGPPCEFCGMAGFHADGCPDQGPPEGADADQEPGPKKPRGISAIRAAVARIEELVPMTSGDAAQELVDQTLEKHTKLGRPKELENVPYQKLLDVISSLEAMVAANPAAE